MFLHWNLWDEIAVSFIWKPLCINSSTVSIRLATTLFTVNTTPVQEKVCSVSSSIVLFWLKLSVHIKSNCFFMYTPQLDQNRARPKFPAQSFPLEVEQHKGLTDKTKDGWCKSQNVSSIIATSQLIRQNMSSSINLHIYSFLHNSKATSSEHKNFIQIWFSITVFQCHTPKCEKNPKKQRWKPSQCLIHLNLNILCCSVFHKYARIFLKFSHQYEPNVLVITDKAQWIVKPLNVGTQLHWP